MSDQGDIITAIVTRINTVSDVGQVHARWRYSKTWDVFLDQMKATVSGSPLVRAWLVTLPEIASSASRFGANERVYSVEVFGVHGISDSSNSEATFLALVESVMDALDFRTDLGSANVVDYTVGPASARFENRMFGSVLAHSVTISVPVIVKKAGTYA